MRRAVTPAEKLRLLNALVASVIAVFFLVHSMLGAASLFVEGLTNSVPWLVWIMLKWATGAVLAATIAAHLFSILCPSSLPSLPGQAKVPLPLLLAALAWHVGIATKSLARDLGIGKRTRGAMRAVYVLAVFALIALMVLVS